MPYQYYNEKVSDKFTAPVEFAEVQQKRSSFTAISGIGIRMEQPVKGLA